MASQLTHETGKYKIYHVLRETRVFTGIYRVVSEVV